MGTTLEGATGTWEYVIGLEVHAQIISKSKLFSGASTEFGAEPNNQVSPVDAGMPGMLPVINMTCIEQAVKTGLAINGRINLTSVFDRKNYFYPDLPQGYQISQFKQPVVTGGYIDVDLEDGGTKRIGVERVHVEQDAGKSLHDQAPDSSYVDLNRSGVGLMEIVSDPDMRSPEEAADYVRKLRTIVRYAETCDGNMQEGSMRVDANVSVRKAGEEFGTRCEIKNLNSVRYMQRAIEFEANRQIDVLEAGGSIEQQTRLFDVAKNETRSMRSKEEAHDYRYFPDPDLLPLRFEQDWVDGIAATMPELPAAKQERFMAEFGLPAYDASVLVAEKENADFYEVVAEGRDKKLAANWVISELFGQLNKAGKGVEDSPVSADAMGELIDLITDDTISARIAKDVFSEMFETGKAAAVIVEEKGLKQVTDTGAIESVIDEVMARETEKVAEYRGGKDKLFGFFIGQVMKASGGKANPKAVNEILRKKLAG
ncbi:MAG: Asp-tRNA(Asn)/Glu-tRNA(Gln) amidotransferase subunit GatB [Rhodospirillaceae bacterium]|jgi:aspartyl-tRNA(Asn)/glutamyl-tRNA(Gln) amidotransferase subunit B|nr:Asp-tRNA(Asn)/Glu-tRNA(Gln) amidotransferase subunit GatB [Rhodospirillaceae bacterium]MBT6205278.1 Asp-tRNA(Asn)/Glu-tRNA(Gln) amidotransferase subunit GatB [Rhodospirillaceae bacterium]MBT7648960.1 Asp-tRNA(Asn)/Glu-tRNA(Gln) amidotransferase subunit GatB [Rhodospirillaceae bacterium]